MSEQSECSICYNTVIDFPAPAGAEATGSHRSSCGHLFHPRCISKWHSGQEHSTCPLCRKEAVSLENCAVEGDNDDDDEDDDEEDNDDVEDDEHYFDDGGAIRISRIGLDYIFRAYGGVGLTAGVEAEINFDEYDTVEITRYEFERMLREQGGAMSDAQWQQLTSIYPPAPYTEEDDDAVVNGAMAIIQAPQITLTQQEPEPVEDTALNSAATTSERVESWEMLQRAAQEVARPPHYYHHVCPLELFAAGDIPPTYGVGVKCDICHKEQITCAFYHCDACEFDVCEECFRPKTPPLSEVVHAPGPFDVEESPHLAFQRADIQRLLQAHGSTATIAEFFNEELDEGTEHTIAVSMTLESLNARFASLGATPVTLTEICEYEPLRVTLMEDGTREVMGQHDTLRSEEYTW